MKKILYMTFLIACMLGATACGTMNTRFRPYVETKQQVEGLQGIVTRGDRSGVYLALKNTTKEDMEVLWEESSLGGDKINQGTYINVRDYSLKRTDSRIKPGEIFQTVLHRNSDIYYLDPVLYQPGGIKIRELKYPTILVLKVKAGKNISTLEMEIKREESLNIPDIEARKTENMIPEMTNKKIETREDNEVRKTWNEA